MTHERRNAIDRMRKFGSEGIRGGMPSGIIIGSTRPTMPQMTKADMRQQADAAWRTWSATRTSS